MRGLQENSPGTRWRDARSRSGLPPCLRRGGGNTSRNVRRWRVLLHRLRNAHAPRSFGGGRSIPKVLDPVGLHGILRRSLRAPRIRCASSAVGLARVRTVRSRPPGDDRRLRSQDPRKGGLGVFSSPRSQSMALQRRSRVSADPPLGARRVGSITRRVCSLPPASARDWVHQHRGADHGAVRRDHGHGRRNHRDEVSPGVGLETAALGGARAS